MTRKIFTALVSFLALSLLLPSLGWGACRTGSWSQSGQYQNLTASGCNGNSDVCYFKASVTQWCNTAGSISIGKYANCVPWRGAGTSRDTYYCNGSGDRESCGNCSLNGFTPVYTCSTLCDTEAEADSLTCVLNPSAEGCRDACSDYKDDCEGRGGSFSGSVNSGKCIGSCNLCQTEVAQTLIKASAQSCCKEGLTPLVKCGFTGINYDGVAYSDVFNLGECSTTGWETNKICAELLNPSSSSTASSSSSSEESSSSNAGGEYCEHFPTDLVCICLNNPDHPDCAYLSSSSGEAGSSDSEAGSSDSEAGSSGSEAGSSGSGGSGGSGGGNDWEYDYRDSLHRIINNGSRTNTKLEGIQGTIEQTNDSLGVVAGILRRARCLFEDCTNYDSLAAAIGGNGGDSSGVGGIDLDTSGYLGGMQAGFDSLRALVDLGDSLAMGDNGTGIHEAQVDTAFEILGHKIQPLGTLDGNNPFYTASDSIKQIIQENFPTSNWGYVQSCPTILSNALEFKIGKVAFRTKTGLGEFVCKPLPTLGLSLGSLARNIFRLLITITMAFGIYRFCMTGGKE